MDQDGKMFEAYCVKCGNVKCGDVHESLVEISTLGQCQKLLVDDPDIISEAGKINTMMLVNRLTCYVDLPRCDGQLKWREQCLIA